MRWTGTLLFVMYHLLHERGCISLFHFCGDVGHLAFLERPLRFARCFPLLCLLPAAVLPAFCRLRSRTCLALRFACYPAVSEYHAPTVAVVLPAMLPLAASNDGISRCARKQTVWQPPMRHSSDLPTCGRGWTGRAAFVAVAAAGGLRFERKRTAASRQRATLRAQAAGWRGSDAGSMRAPHSTMPDAFVQRTLPHAQAYRRPAGACGSTCLLFCIGFSAWTTPPSAFGWPPSWLGVAGWRKRRARRGALFSCWRAQDLWRLAFLRSFFALRVSVAGRSAINAAKQAGAATYACPHARTCTLRCGRMDGRVG